MASLTDMDGKPISIGDTVEMSGFTEEDFSDLENVKGKVIRFDRDDEAVDMIVVRYDNGTITLYPEYLRVLSIAGVKRNSSAAGVSIF